MYIFNTYYSRYILFNYYYIIYIIIYITCFYILLQLHTIHTCIYICYTYYLHIITYYMPFKVYSTIKSEGISDQPCKHGSKSLFGGDALSQIHMFCTSGLVHSSYNQLEPTLDLLTTFEYVFGSFFSANPRLLYDSGELTERKLHEPKKSVSMTLKQYLA